MHSTRNITHVSLVLYVFANGAVASRSTSAPVASEAITPESSAHAATVPGCTYHDGAPLTIFCESCGTSICRKCESAFHSLHGTVPLVTKSAENETTLKELLPVFAKGQKGIADKLQELRRVKENFEKVEEKAKTQMQLQYDYIKLQLDTYLDDQMKILEKVKRDELLKVEEETTKLHQQSQEMKRLEEKGLELMDQKGSLNFIIESNALLQKRHLAEMTHGSQSTWTHTAEPVYQRPIYWQAAESEEFRQLIQDQILGQLRIQEPQQIGSSAEIGEPGTRRVGSSFPASNFQGSHFSLASQTSSGRSRSAESLPYSSTHSLADPSRFYRQRRYGLRGSFTSLQEEPTYMRNQSESIAWMASDSTRKLPTATEVSAELQFRTGKSPSGTNLKVFHDALFTEESNWISGCTKNRIMKNETILANVHGPKYKVMVSKGKTDEFADVPTVMALRGENIFYAKKGRNEIFALNTHSHTLNLKYVSDDAPIQAMCCSKDRLFLKTPDFIRVLDSRFNPMNPIPLENDDTHSYDVDMCFVQNHDLDLDLHHQGAPAAGHVIVYSKSAPNSYVRAVNNLGDVVWQVDHSQMDSRFDACSVTSSTAGDVLIADRGTNTVGTSVFLFVQQGLPISF